MKHSFLILLLALFLPFGTGYAQNKDELETFQEASGVLSMLFRGKQDTRLSFLANGNPYWEQPEFVNGDIVFENNLYRNVLLNINAWQQRAVVKSPSGLKVVSLTPAQVSSLVVNGRHFVGVGPDEALPEGFYEVFGTGEVRVYKHVEKKLNDYVGDVNGSIIGYYDVNYRPDVYRHFAIGTSYYFRDAEGRFSRIRNKSALLRHFPERKKEIRKAVKAAGVEYSKRDFDAYCQAVLNAAAR